MKLILFNVVKVHSITLFTFSRKLIYSIIYLIWWLWSWQKISFDETFNVTTFLECSTSPTTNWRRPAATHGRWCRFYVTSDCRATTWGPSQTAHSPPSVDWRCWTPGTSPSTSFRLAKTSKKEGNSALLRPNYVG